MNDMTEREKKRNIIKSKTRRVCSRSCKRDRVYRESKGMFFFVVTKHHKTLAERYFISGVPRKTKTKQQGQSDNYLCVFLCVCG